LSFCEEPRSNFEDDILVLLEGTNGALEHRALPGLAVFQLILELRQRTLTPKFKAALTRVSTYPGIDNLRLYISSNYRS